MRQAFNNSRRQKPPKAFRQAVDEQGNIDVPCTAAIAANSRAPAEVLAARA